MPVPEPNAASTFFREVSGNVPIVDQETAMLRCILANYKQPIIIITQSETKENQALFLLSWSSSCLTIIELHLLQNVRVEEVTAPCNPENKGLLRMANLHLEFCNGKSWVRLSDVTGPVTGQYNSSPS